MIECASHLKIEGRPGQTIVIRGHKPDLNSIRRAQLLPVFLGQELHARRLIPDGDDRILRWSNIRVAVPIDKLEPVGLVLRHGELGDHVVPGLAWQDFEGQCLVARPMEFRGLQRLVRAALDLHDRADERLDVPAVILPGFGLLPGVGWIAEGDLH